MEQCFENWRNKENRKIQPGQGAKTLGPLNKRKVKMSEDGNFETADTL